VLREKKTRRDKKSRIISRKPDKRGRTGQWDKENGRIHHQKREGITKTWARMKRKKANLARQIQKGHKNVRTKGVEHREHFMYKS